MREVILKNKYVEISFDDENQLYTSKYLRETENMTDKEWQQQMLMLKGIIEQLKPVYIIDDNRERLYSYSPDMQLWTLNLFVESWNGIGLKKYAQIIPEEIVGKLTSEQIEDVALTDFKMLYQHKFVNDFDSALEWIKEVN